MTRTISSPSINSKETLGLGLAVVARYVRNMNGQIRVRSDKGKGTVFGIELPFEHVDPTAPVTSNLALANNSGLISSMPLILDGSSMYDGADRTISSQDVTHTPLATPVTEKSSATVYPDVSLPTIMEADSVSLASTASPAMEPSGTAFPFPGMTRDSLSVLVAEDNPINAILLQKRLLKVGHKISYDGQACHDQFTGNPLEVDVILIDLQIRLSLTLLV